MSYLKEYIRIIQVDYGLYCNKVRSLNMNPLSYSQFSDIYRGYTKLSRKDKINEVIANTRVK